MKDLKDLFIGTVEQYDEVRKVSIGQGDDYTTRCLLEYAYFKDIFQLIAVDLSKQKALDADPRAVQQIVIQGVVGGDDNTKIRLYTTFEFRINGTPRLLIIPFFATFLNLIQHSPFINFGEFCQSLLLFQTPRLLIHVHSQSTAVA